MTAQAQKGAAKRRRPEAPSVERLTLDYHLAALPSAQHRAGLAGLVLLVRHLERQPGGAGVVQLTRLDEEGLTLELDRPGLRRILDEVYAASWEEQEEGQIRKDRQGQPVPPKRESQREVVDPKDKTKTKTKKVFVYDVVVPAGRVLRDMDPNHEEKGQWLKLWRDLLWSVLRGVPATRQPFEARADRAKAVAAGQSDDEEPGDVADLWAELTQRADGSVDLPSTYYLGAQSVTAEGVPFQDRARNRFLLQFWSYAVAIYVPRVVADLREGRLEYLGYCVAVPDVARLSSFCEDWTLLLRGRPVDPKNFRPPAALIDLELQGALDLALRLRNALRDRVAQRAGNQRAQDTVLGVEIYHLNKEGNNVRLLSSARCEPVSKMLDRYQGYQVLTDHLLRRQVLSNLVAGRPWWAGFDRLAATTPTEKQLIGSSYFRADVRELFKRDESNKETDMDKTDDAAPRSLETLVKWVVDSYVSGRVKSKFGLDYKGAKGDEKQTSELKEKQRRVAMDAFLAVRSRRGEDFVNYFAEVLCSVRQPLSKAEDFKQVARALQEQRDDVRTLTLLALSTHG